MALSARFIDGAAGRILLTCHRPAGTIRHAVIVLPAFGEEMNKSRRLVRNTADRLAEAGYLVVIPDLFGCGDSEGDIAEASLSIWREDLAAAIAWAKADGTDRVSALVVRGGAMLLDRFPDAQGFERVICWQPVDGAQTLRDLLRIHVLNRRLGGHTADTPEKILERLLESGGQIDLSGYAITANLASEMLEAGSGMAFDRDNFMVVRFGHGDAAVGETVVGGERFWRAMDPGPNDELVSSTIDLFVD